MASKRVLVLSASVGSGHKTAAQALEEEFQRRAGVEVVNQDALELTNEAYRTFNDDLYHLLVKRVPGFVGWNYELNDQPFVGESLLRKLWDLLNAQPLLRFIRDYDPNLTVCTHFMPGGVVSQLLARGQLHTALAVVMTDYDFQGMWLPKMFNRFFVALDETKARMVALGLDSERIVVSGIPIDRRFGEPVDRAPVLAKYALRDDLPILLISAGALGGGPARELAAQALQLQHPTQVIVACGRNERLRHDIEALALPQAGRFRVLGFTDDMVNLVRLATLFVGKPGGLTTAECMAAGTPMVVNTPTPGQEERNSDHLLESGAAIRVNEAATFAFKIDRLLADPDRLARMRDSARRLGRPDAARVLVDRLLDDQLDPLRLGREEQVQILQAAQGVQVVPPAQMIALYEDTTGVYLGAIPEAQFRAVRRYLRRPDEPVLTIVLDQNRVELLRSLGVDPAVCDAIERRLARAGELTVRRSRL